MFQSVLCLYIVCKTSMLQLNSTIFKFSIKILQYALDTKQWKEKKKSKVDIIATEKSWVGGI